MGEKATHFEKGMKEVSLEGSPLETVEKILADARGGNNTNLSASVFREAVVNGIKDFSNLEVPSGVYEPQEGVEYVDMDLRGARIHNVQFFHVRFGATKLTDAHLCMVDWHSSQLKDVDMDTIYLPHEDTSVRVELRDRELVLEQDAIWDIEGGQDVAGSCAMCEVLNQEILENKPFSQHARRGVLLFQEGRPLGYMKLKGSRSFLALRTVRNKHGEVLFWKGMVYALTSNMVTVLGELSRPHAHKRGVWRKVDVEALKSYFDARGQSASFLKNNMRFLESAHFYKLLSGVVDRIEAGKERMIELLPDIAREVKKQKQN